MDDAPGRRPRGHRAGRGPPLPRGRHDVVRRAAWEPHAQHVAVEFVHPVIVGKRALPAVALTGPDLVATARISVRPGDLVVAVASAADPDVRSIMRRAPAWGATTIWIGSGPRPDAGAADHVLWLDDPDPLVPATGRFVLLYHLLWELTHVCFEHPGLLDRDRGPCTDDGLHHLLRRGAARRGGRRRGRVRTAAGVEDVETTLVDPVRARRPPARPRGHGDRDGCPSVTELPLPVHRRRGARPGRAAARPRRLGRRQGRRERGAARVHAGRQPRR